MSVCGANVLIRFGTGEIDFRMLFNLCNVSGSSPIRCLKESRILDIVATRKVSSYDAILFAFATGFRDM